MAVLPAPWNLHLPDIRFLCSNKHHMKAEIQSIFHEFISKHATYKHVYTDGSKIDDKTGCAVYIPGVGSYRYRLPSYLSIFNSEFYAIYRALFLITNFKYARSIIFTDSYSSLQQLLHSPPVDALHQKIIHLYQQLVSSGAVCILVWVPAHRDIQGNETADKEAKSALNETYIHLYPPDKKTTSLLISHSVRKFFQAGYTDHQGLPHGSIHTLPTSHKMQSRTIARLQMGHTRLTHSHLMNRLPPPVCTECQLQLTMTHIIESCTKYSEQRRHLLSYCIRIPVPLTLQTILRTSDRKLISILLNFLHRIDIIHEI